MASQVARWVSSVRAWMQSAMAISWLLGVFGGEGVVVSGSAKIASDAMECMFRASDSFSGCLWCELPRPLG